MTAATEVETTVVATDPSREIDQELVDQLLDEAGDDQQLLGEGGLVQQLTKQVLETALDTELTAHLGFERGDADGRGSGNSRRPASRSFSCRLVSFCTAPHRTVRERTVSERVVTSWDSSAP